MSRTQQNDDPEFDPTPQSHDASHAEKKLWFAVIERTVNDAKGKAGQGVSAAESHQIRAEARAWLRSTSVEAGSLRWIIAQTGIRLTQAALLREVLEDA